MNNTNPISGKFELLIKHCDRLAIPYEILNKKNNFIVVDLFNNKMSMNNSA